MKKGVKINIEVYDSSGNLVGKDENYLAILENKELLPKIEEGLKSMKEGDEKELVLKPEDAYGERKKDLIKIIPIDAFKKNKLNPVPGLVVNVDGFYGKVLSVSGGRVQVDFNHPLAGKTLKYKIKLVKEVNTREELAKEIVKRSLKEVEKINIGEEEIEIVVKKDISPGLKDYLSKELKSCCDFKKVVFSTVY